MKLNTKQRTAWLALGEAMLDICVRAADLSVPDSVALDRIWLLRSVRKLKALVNRWAKTLPGTRGHSLNVERRKARGMALLNVLPMLIAEASDGEATMTVTVAQPPSDEFLYGPLPVSPEELN